MLAWCAAHTARRIFGSPRDLGLEGSLQRNPARRGAGLLAASFRHQPRQRGAQLEELLGGVLPHLPGGRRAPRAFVVAADDGAVAIQMASALLLHMLQARAPRRALGRWAPSAASRPGPCRAAAPHASASCLLSNIAEPAAPAPRRPGSPVRPAGQRACMRMCARLQRPAAARCRARACAALCMSWKQRSRCAATAGERGLAGS